MQMQDLKTPKIYFKQCYIIKVLVIVSTACLLEHYSSFCSNQRWTFSDFRKLQGSTSTTFLHGDCGYHMLVNLVSKK